MSSLPGITGYHAIEEILRRGGAGGTLYVSDSRSRNTRLRALAERQGVRVTGATPDELEAMSGGRDPRGCVYVPDRPEAAASGDLRSEIALLVDGPRLVVVLDHIYDPHNLGAVLRSADQFGADLVVLPSRRSAQVSPTVARASAGASAHVRTVVVTNIATSIRLLKDAEFWVYGAHLRGERLDGVGFAARTALVLGSEGHGLAELVASECDGLVRIPSAGHVDSLNVSVAAGILMYEVRRSQGYFTRDGGPASRT